MTVRDTRKQKGARGEELACSFLGANGFSLLAKNWRCRYGEIDLIMQRGEEIRFVEVKTRQGNRYGFPEESVTFTKQQHLRRAIEAWLQRYPAIERYQLDVIAIEYDGSSTPSIRWIEAVL